MRTSHSCFAIRNDLSLASIPTRILCNSVIAIFGFVHRMAVFTRLWCAITDAAKEREKKRIRISFYEWVACYVCMCMCKGENCDKTILVKKSRGVGLNHHHIGFQLCYLFQLLAISYRHNGRHSINITANGRVQNIWISHVEFVGITMTTMTGGMERSEMHSKYEFLSRTHTHIRLESNRIELNRRNTVV